MNQPLITLFFDHLYLVYWTITALVLLLGIYLVTQSARSIRQRRKTTRTAVTLRNGHP